jgi:hypothetical protein
MKRALVVVGTLEFYSLSLIARHELYRRHSRLRLRSSGEMNVCQNHLTGAGIL